MTISKTAMQNKNESIEKICYNWWAQLTSKNLGQMRADHARLRRADSVSAALIVDAVHSLNAKLSEEDCDLRQRPDRLALIALSLAHIKESGSETLAKRMGKTQSFSETRFTTIIRTTDPVELISLVRRALSVIGNAANVNRLSTDLFWWNDATRNRWCFDFYDVSNVSPNSKKQDS